MRNIEKIQEKLITENAKRPIRVQGLLKKRKETLEQFLTKFFTKWNDERDTIYVDDQEVQTDAGCRRSVGDVFKIAKYYFPNATLDQVSNFLYKKAQQAVPRFRSSYCNQINKRVFYQGDEDEEPEFYNTDKTDEHGMIVSQWKRQIKT